MAADTPRYARRHESQRRLAIAAFGVREGWSAEAALTTPRRTSPPLSAFGETKTLAQ